MEKKNIAIVITRLDLGGAQQVALYLAENLDRKKYNVHLICGKGGYLDEAAKKIKDLNLFFLDELIHPINIVFDIAAYVRLISYFEKNKIDIVHTHSSKAGLLGRLAAATAGNKPLIAHTIHGFPFHKYQNPAMHMAYILLERFAALFTDKLVAVGADTAQYGLKNGVGIHEKYAIIRAAVDLEKFRSAGFNGKTAARFLKSRGLKSGVFTVAMIGNLKKQKNPMAFVKIAKSALAKEPDMQFIFAGDGPLREDVEVAVIKNKLQGKVIFIGWCNEPETLLAASDAYLLTSLWEGLPCTLVQAASAGLPAVASYIDGNKEFVNLTGCGVLFEPFDYSGAAEKLIDIKGKKLKFRYDKNILKQFGFKLMLAQYDALFTGMAAAGHKKIPA
jgi:glycosyltransferase involved in cell wall biosynthesis